MSELLRGWSRQINRLCEALAEIEPEAERLGTSGPAGEEWFELLTRKLRPQLELDPVIVVAVVGGTNIGKSAIFNQLAGEVASGVSPLAAGTKHPVCLVPRDLNRPEFLQQLFDGFELQPWHEASDPLEDSDAHQMFWRVGKNTPPQLLLVDTPDIDSDALVNWQRADQIRQAADVLIAVLTQQKYNDASVKQFFRKAIEADKPIFVMFNQVDLEEDRPIWPQWLRTFVSETGAAPESVYVVPYDRHGAGSLGLVFYNVGIDGTSAPKPASPRDELASLHFEAIKSRTFRGAIQRVLDQEQGAPHYLVRLRYASREFQNALDALSAAEMARVQWPSLPPRMLVDEIRTWWDEQRQPWSRAVHGFYRRVGQGATWPVRKAWSTFVAGDTPEPEKSFAQREREAIILAVEKLLDELDRLSRVGNEVLRPRLAKLLGGNSRRELLERVQASHAQLPALDDDYRQFVRTELDRWGHENPRAVSFLRSLDHVLAVARPAITVSLAVSGWVLAGGLVHEAAATAVSHTAGELATEAVVAGGVAGGGEMVVGTTGEGIKLAAAQLFRRLQTEYAQSRARWLSSWLERELLGGLLGELKRGAELPHHEAFRRAEAALVELARPARDLAAAPTAR